MSESPAIVSFDDFRKLDLRIGTVIQADVHPAADKLMVLQVDLGPQRRQLVAGIREHYEAGDLVGKQIVVVANLAPRKMRGIESQGMLLAASSPDQSQVILLTPERPIAPGAQVS